MKRFRYVITYGCGTKLARDGEGYLDATWIGAASWHVTRLVRQYPGARLKLLEPVNAPISGGAFALARVRHDR